MGGMLAQYVKLSLKQFGIERAILTCSTVTIVIAKNNEGLENRWFLAAGSRTQNGAVCRNCAPTEHTKTQPTGDVGKDCLEGLKLDGIVGPKENVADSILARLGQNTAHVRFSLSFEEEVRDAGHDASTVPIAAVGPSGAAVGHGAE